jgi:fatty acid desaturase
MNGDDLHRDIARIEAHIEALTESIERCRKISFAARFAIAAGAIWIVLVLLWVIPFVPYMVVAAMAAVIGGIVLLGSNATTWAQTESALQASETMRAEWIENMHLRVVEGESRTVH